MFVTRFLSHHSRLYFCPLFFEFGLSFYFGLFFEFDDRCDFFGEPKTPKPLQPRRLRHTTTAVVSATAATAPFLSYDHCYQRNILVIVPAALLPPPLCFFCNITATTAAATSVATAGAAPVAPQPLQTCRAAPAIIPPLLPSLTPLTCHACHTITATAATSAPLRPLHLNYRRHNSPFKTEVFAKGLN